MADQYTWDKAKQAGYKVDVIPLTRQTIADGNLLNASAIDTFSGRDKYLLDSLNAIDSSARSVYSTVNSNSAYNWADGAVSGFSAIKTNSTKRTGAPAFGVYYSFFITDDRVLTGYVNDNTFTLAAKDYMSNSYYYQMLAGNNTDKDGEHPVYIMADTTYDEGTHKNVESSAHEGIVLGANNIVHSNIFDSHDGTHRKYIDKCAAYLDDNNASAMGACAILSSYAAENSLAAYMSTTKNTHSRLSVAFGHSFANGGLSLINSYYDGTNQQNTMYGAALLGSTSYGGFAALNSSAAPSTLQSIALINSSAYAGFDVAAVNSTAYRASVALMDSSVSSWSVGFATPYVGVASIGILSDCIMNGSVAVNTLTAYQGSLGFNSIAVGSTAIGFNTTRSYNNTIVLNSTCPASANADEFSILINKRHQPNFNTYVRIGQNTFGTHDLTPEQMRAIMFDGEDFTSTANRQTPRTFSRGIAINDSDAVYNSLAVNESYAADHSFAMNNSEAYFNGESINRASYDFAFTESKVAGGYDNFALMYSTATNCTSTIVSYFSTAQGTNSCVASYYGTAYGNNAIAMYRSQASTSSIALFDSTAASVTVSGIAFDKSRISNTKYYPNNDGHDDFAYDDYTNFGIALWASTAGPGELAMWNNDVVINDNGAIITKLYKDDTQRGTQFMQLSITNRPYMSRGAYNELSFCIN